jgi:hypothetical protein
MEIVYLISLFRLWINLIKYLILPLLVFSLSWNHKTVLTVSKSVMFYKEWNLASLERVPQIGWKSGVVRQWAHDE